MTLHLTAKQRRLLDVFEQTAVVLLYSWMVIRLLPRSLDDGGYLAVSILLISEGVVVVLLILRRPTSDISLRIGDWVLAAGGTFLVLLVRDSGATFAESLGAFIMLVGFFVHIGAKFSLLRSFGLVAANRGVKVGGLYAYVRHPMYAGYMLTHIGFLFAVPSLWNGVIYLAVWSFLLARIHAEERILNRDAQYRDYSLCVRHRIIPGIY